MEKIYIVAAKRSAIGTMLGSLANVDAGELGATVVKDMFATFNVKPEQVDSVIVGNVLSAGLGQNVARQVLIKAGVSEEVCAYSVNMVCGSGMKAVLNAVNEVKVGMSKVVVAGGTEVMSGAPFLIPYRARGGMKMGDFNTVDHMIYDSLTDAFSKAHMGITAENVAEKYGITRKQQDEFAYASQQKAIKSVDEGVFDKEITPIEVKIGKNIVEFKRDEHPNRTSTPEKLAQLRSAFKKDGTVTAGNASGINDGASFVVVASESAVKEYGYTPIAEIVSTGQGGVDPQYMGLGPVPAIRQALKNADTKLCKMDMIELNEAFAAQSLSVVKLLSEEHGMSQEQIMEKTNIHGGAIALGHPVGASGNRILVTLLYGLAKGQTGLASLCIGGGMGTAIIVKKL
ncbi:MAG: acetyl-CoA C-acetyltransferase [Clostridia bacterium]|nr:acetyl-CoA C-acetyltransferase [Clostridia bacterium]